MAETHNEGTNEESPQPGEPMDEDQDTQHEDMERSEPMIDEQDQDVKLDEDKIKDIDEHTQDTEEISTPIGETGEDEQEPVPADTLEPDEEENNQDDDCRVPDEEEGTHSSGYNLRERKKINYSETRKYNTTATVLYQYGEFSGIKENLVANLNGEKVVEPNDMFKRCVGICMN